MGQGDFGQGVGRSRKRQVPLYLNRRIVVDEDGLTITDTLRVEGNMHLERLTPGRHFSTIHMGSARYFQDDHLDSIDHDGPPPEEVARRVISDGEITVERRWSFVPETTPNIAATRGAR